MFFLINSKAAQFILISRNQVWTKKVSLIIVLYLIFPSCLNLQKELSNYVLPSTCPATTCSILSSLLTSNIILLKLLFFLFMTTSSRLWVDNRSLVSLFLTCLLLLTLYIIIFFLNVSHLGLVSHQLPSLGFNLTSSSVLFM